MHQHKIIHIPSIKPDAQIMLDIMVKQVQVKVCKYLTGQVADWQTTVFRTVKQAFGFGQSLPILLFSLYNAIFSAIVENYLLAKFNQKRLVRVLIMSTDEPVQPSKQDIFVDVHEKSLNVKLQDVTVAGIIVRTLPYEPVDPLYSKVCAFARTASVTVVYEMIFKNRVQFVDHQMMNNPVAEIGGKYLTLYGFVYNKGDGFTWLVSAIINFAVKRNKVTFVIHLESKRVICVALGFPAIEIGFE